MAQHTPLLYSDNKHLAKIIHGIKYDIQRSYTGLKGSFKYEPLPDDYLENDDTSVFMASRKVPTSLVYGGVANIEVHLKGNKLNMIYLVA